MHVRWLALATVVFACAGGAQAKIAGSIAVIDATFSCASVLGGGEYALRSHAHAGARLDGSWARLPYAGLRTGVFSGATGNLLAWVTAGDPIATTTIDQDFNTFDVRTFGTIGVRRELCRSSKASVPLTPAGLRGGSAPPLGTEYRCAVPRRVLLHVRAVLRAPASLRGTEFLSSHVPIREARIAVRTLAGQPLSYAEVRESGKATLFTARRCVPD
jgi:hypothetical protein